MNKRKTTSKLSRLALILAGNFFVAFGILGIFLPLLPTMPFDPRVLIWEASAVARTAIETGVARKQIDIEQYKQQLEARLGKQKEVMRIFINKAKTQPKRIVFPEGNEEKILRACQVIIDEGIAKPILLGKKDAIIQKVKELSLDILDNTEIVEPAKYPRFDEYVGEFFQMRQRKGVPRVEAEEIVKQKMLDLIIDGEMQADTAVVPEILNSTYPFSRLKEKANVLIFPDLQSGNIAYKLLERLSGAKAVGPILMGMNKPVHVLQRGASVDDIVNLAAIAVVDAQKL